LRPPLTSALFPYTTLFRSLLQQGGIVVVDGLGKLRTGPLLSFVRRRRQRCLGGQGKNHRHPWAAALASSTSKASVRIRTSTYNRDRKSTRLNSSHVSISYA